MPADKPDLDTAYALETPEDNRALYAGWAETYEETFARAMDFRMPGHVAQKFVETGGQGPVLDAGAGTGLLGQALHDAGIPDIDGLDLSPEMLDVARRKNVYRDLVVGDMTRPLPLPDATWYGIVSSGTFTHGHVGPDAFDELMRVAAPGALFVVTIKTELFDSAGFGAKFAGFGGKIKGLESVELPIYGPAATGDHRDDKGLVVSFRKS
ncbi:class I SAM-dependent methyltransferase [uncultured Roseobacter sp.]|uniref:class I SAM-dependent DNA methyltransferase n=1 Tax=uncultured Roseobacter sp. TaxID=114847 RepID=UPI002609F110|nr:class I SAM-dependent methyltransferase [uncultured Roseobacter sp.]